MLNVTGSEGTAPASEASESLRDIRQLNESEYRASPRSQAAWTRLYARYKSKLLRHAERQLGKAGAGGQSAEDLIGEAWFRALKSWEDFEYQGPGSLLAWLRKQVDRSAKDVLRKEGRRAAKAKSERLKAIIPALQSEDPASGPSSVAARRDQVDRAKAALARVPEFYQRALRLVFIENRERAEVAEMLDVKPNTLTRQLLRGLDHWRSAMGLR